MDDRQNRADQQWPEYTVNDRQVIVLDTGNQLETQNGLRDRHCHFWSAFIPRLRAASTAGTEYSHDISRFIFKRRVCHNNNNNNKSRCSMVIESLAFDGIT